MTSDESNEESGLVDRRAMIKKTAVGAAAAGIVWSAPKVEGLSLRPSYAAAGTGGGGNTDFAAVSVPGSATQSLGGGNVQVTLNNFNQFTRLNVVYNGAGTLSLNAWDTNPSRSAIISHIGHANEGNQTNAPQGNNTIGHMSPSLTQMDAFIGGTGSNMTHLRFTCT